MRRVLSLAAALLMAGLCVSVHAANQQTTPKPKKKKVATNSTTLKRPPARTATATHKSAGVAQAKAANKSRSSMAKSHPKPAGSAATTHKAKKGTHKTASTWRTRQTAPTPDRYREIQSALATKGYLKSDDASGKWDQASVDAMKKFQADQNIEATGKLNSLSLIALGLGPRHDTGASVVAPGSPAAQSAN